MAWARLLGKSQPPRKPRKLKVQSFLSYLATIAVVEDDSAIRAAYRDLLRSCGLQTMMFECAEDFLADGATKDAGCLILDQRLPGMSGLELQGHLRALESCIPVVFVTSHDDDVTKRKALAGGACHFLSKPINPDRLLECLSDALRSRQAAHAPSL